jgi:2-iminoacetate synthase
MTQSSSFFSSTSDAWPDDLSPFPWRSRIPRLSARDVQEALDSDTPTESHLAALLSPAAQPFLETIAHQAQHLTFRHFGRTIALYVPLYLSDICSGGCVYCGFAADRPRPRRALSLDEVERELQAIKALQFEEILLLTGERCPQVGVDYLESAIRLAARHFHRVTIEVFPMDRPEYHRLACAGCTAVSLYQETYQKNDYASLHRWGPKRDYDTRLEAPTRALDAGIRSIGLGALWGLADPLTDALALYRHVRRLQRRFWQSEITLAFPRIRPQTGDFQPPFPVDERFLAQMIWAFRICLPTVSMSLSTRESPAFRDGMAGVGINKMSIASRTTVGGYQTPHPVDEGQFIIHDDRDLPTFCRALKNKGLEPVFKNWESLYRTVPA